MKRRDWKDRKRCLSQKRRNRKSSFPFPSLRPPPRGCVTHIFFFFSGSAVREKRRKKISSFFFFFHPFSPHPSSFPFVFSFIAWRLRLQSPLSLTHTHTSVRTWYMYGTPAHPTDYHMYHHRHVRSRNILSRTFVRLPTQLGYLFLPPARGEEELGRRALGTLETRGGPSSFSPLRSIEGTSQGRKSSLTRCRPLAAKGGMMDADRQMDYSWHHAASAFRPPIARRHSLLQASARMPCI